MTNTKILTALSALALVAMPTAAHAQDQDTIQVVATSALADWQKDTSDALDAALSRAPSLKGGTANEAIVQIAFDVGPRGKAQNIRVLEGEANAASQRAALYAVRSLDNLDDMPTMANGRSVLANIILADNPTSQKKLAYKLAKSERKRIASGSGMSDYVTIGAVPITVDTD